MNWKLELQLCDLEPHQRLEMTCKQCGHVHYRLVADLLSHPELTFVWLNEIERDECCPKHGCRGSIRLAMCHNHSTSGFIGGLA